MKKSILIMPAMLLLLTACGNTQGTSQGAPSMPSVPSMTAQPSATPTISIEPVNPGPTEFEGYAKLFEAPEDQKVYVFGNYQANLDKMIFMDGDTHRDLEGEYPWYATSQEHPAGALQIKVEYVDETNFTLQAIGGGAVTTNHGKYLSVHETLNEKTGSKTISFLFVDDPVNWQFNEDLETVYRDLTDEVSSEMEVESACLGTYEEYETFSAVSDFRYDTNFIAHLWYEIVEE